MNRNYPKVLLLMILFSYGTESSAQTYYSYRMRSMSAYLSGVVDDPLTDVYLNPARLGAFRQVEVYGTQLPGRNVNIPFPISALHDYNFGPKEVTMMEFSYSPIALSMFLPVGDRAVFSLGTETYWWGDDDARKDIFYRRFYPYYGDVLEKQISSYERASDKKHFLLDLAMARLGEAAFGVRLTAYHDSYHYTMLDPDTRLETDFLTQTEISIYDEIEIYYPKYEKTNIKLALGLTRPGRRLTDAVIGASVSRQLRSALSLRSWIDNEDVDGNGRNIGGDPPELTFYDQIYDSHRDYRGYQLFARAHWNANRKFRFAHFISWERSEGDGGAVFEQIEEEYEGAVYDISRQRGYYEYDGTLSQLIVNTTVGFSQEIHEGFLVCAGMRGTYSREQFEEDGRGDASMFLDKSSSVYDSLTLTSDYAQRIDTDNRRYHFCLPVACEWQPHEFLKLRAGIEFSAFRYNDRTEYDRSAAALDVQNELPLRDADLDCDIEYGNIVRFNQGIEVNIKEKFILDFLTFSTASINLAEYGYLSVRYRF